MKSTLFFIFCLLYIATFLIPGSASAKSSPQILIIDQVRGEECCDKGSITALKKQIDVHVKNSIPVTFAIRYDALKDDRYVSILKKASELNPKIINLGISLEITPLLAKESSVSYGKKSANWYEAQNLFSIGYSYEDNELMSEVLFGAFYEKFAYYPSVSSSWMIKTSLLNRIAKKYGIKVHQITREQWGTDSYSLYGGPPHYPYPASSNWVFMPDYTREDGPLIVRQTVTDPLYNYGDNTSSYTSQPNDYLRDKTFSYFQALLDQALNEQAGRGFVLLGLENSMGDIYQTEYVKQIELVKKYLDKKAVILPNPSELASVWKDQKVSSYWGKDIKGSTDNESFWISTPKYRVRLRKENDELFIDDIRIFSRSFSDPYDGNLAESEGFWIAPFLLDGSLVSKDKKLFSLSQPKTENNFVEVKHDVGDKPSRILLPGLSEGEIKSSQKNDQFEITYRQKGRKDVSIIFGEESIDFQGFSKQDITHERKLPSNYPVKWDQRANGFSLYWSLKGNTWSEMLSDCNVKGCIWRFGTVPELIDEVRRKDYAFLMPEPAGHPLDKEKSVLFANNNYAIAGRNPVRFIIIPYDMFGIVTSLKEGCKDISVNVPGTKCIQDGRRYFLDVYGNGPGAVDVSVRLDKHLTKENRIFFAPNCKSDIKSCLNPIKSWWYLRAIAGDKARQIIYKEKQ